VNKTATQANLSFVSLDSYQAIIYQTI
jgi:hypothetical protein